MKNKVRLISSILLIVAISVILLALTSCTREIDYETFHERAEEAVDAYDSVHGTRNGAITFENERYEFIVRMNVERDWLIEFDESISDFDKGRLHSTFASWLLTRADDYNVDSAEKFGLYIGFEEFQLEKGFEIESGDVIVRFDEYGFITDIIEAGEPVIAVEWWL